MLKSNTISIQDDYIAYTEDHQVPIFYRPYYLDAVCGRSHWNVLIFDESQYFVYHHRRVGPVTFWIQPQLTPHLGVPNRSDCLPATIPWGTYIDMNTDVNPNGNGTKYTYRLSREKNLEELEKGLKKSHRRYIKVGRKAHRVKELDYEIFCEYLEDFFSAQGKYNPFPMDVLYRVESVLSERGERTILCAVDDSNTINAVIYLVHDHATTYLLASAYRQGSRANYYLTWESILRSMAEGRDFDFKGSMLPGIERFYQGFGGDKHHYVNWRKTHPTALAYFVNKMITLKKRLTRKNR